LGEYKSEKDSEQVVRPSEPRRYPQRPFRVLRAFRPLDEEMQMVLSYLQDCQRLGMLPDAVLIDAYQAGAYGGTGKTANWITASNLLRKLAASDGGQKFCQVADAMRDNASLRTGLERASFSLSRPLPMALAGGLRPDNVAEAIRIVRPAAVDTASGVETSPGRKDARLVREFVERARRAFGQFANDSDTGSA
jgi:phosphoribosylanthranilate isomerase